MQCYLVTLVSTIFSSRNDVKYLMFFFSTISENHCLAMLSEKPIRKKGGSTHLLLTHDGLSGSYDTCVNASLMSASMNCRLYHYGDSLLRMGSVSRRTPRLVIRMLLECRDHGDLSLSDTSVDASDKRSESDKKINQSRFVLTRTASSRTSLL